MIECLVLPTCNEYSVNELEYQDTNNDQPWLILGLGLILWLGLGLGVTWGRKYTKAQNDSIFHSGFTCSYVSAFYLPTFLLHQHKCKQIF